MGKNTITKDRKKLRKQLKSISVLRKASNCLIQTKGIEIATVYDGKDSEWGFYKTVSGWIDTKYFYVLFMLHNQLDIKGSIEIQETTDCSVVTEDILSDYSHLVIIK